MKRDTKAATFFHFTESLGGGVLTSLSILADIQINAGHKVFIVFTRRIETPFLPELRAIFRGCELIDLGGSSILNSLKMLIFCYKIRRKSKDIILHAHSSIAGVIVRIVALFSKSFSNFYTPHGFAFLRKDITFWKYRLFFYSEVLLARNSKAITLACGPTELKIAKEIGSVSAKELRNAIPLNSSQVRAKLPKRSMRLASVGRICNQKNPILFSEIAQILKMEAEIIWVGDGDSAARQRIIDSGAAVTGWLLSEDLYKCLDSIDLLIMTSLWEGLPIVALECMSRGIPIVSFGFEGCEDIVIDGKTGFIRSGIDDLVLVVRRLINDDEMYQTMSANALDYFKENYTVDRLVRTWRESYGITE